MKRAEGERSVPFQERFDLLVESGQANEKSVAGTRLAVALVEKHYGVQLSEELGSALVNHLAITLKRLLEGQQLVAMPDVVWQELQDYPEERALAQTIIDELEGRLQVPLSRDEVGFLAIHLCKIRQDAGLDGGSPTKGPA